MTYPCPCCGFLVFNEPLGSYDICDLCGWEDYYFRRLSAVEADDIGERGEWPADYDDFVNVWPLDGAQNFRARLYCPWKGEEFEIR